MKSFFSISAIGFYVLFSQLSYSQEITIYDAKKLLFLGSLFSPGELVIDKNVILRDNLKPNILKLKDNFEAVYHYHKENFNRDSWDDKGSTIEAIVNLRGVVKYFGLKENASWYSAKNRFLFGYGKIFGLNDFEKSLDVVAHEYTHAIIQTTSNLKYSGQSGALNEHLADVFGVLINKKVNKPQRPYVIGLGIQQLKPRMPLRNLEDPKDSLSVQPVHMKDLDLPEFSQFKEPCLSSEKNDHCGVHVLSGIPNKMAVQVIKELGDDLAGQIFYHVMTEKLTTESNFKDYRNALLKECENYLNQNQNACKIIENALNQVGII